MADSEEAIKVTVKPSAQADDEPKIKSSSTPIMVNHESDEALQESTTDSEIVDRTKKVIEPIKSEIKIVNDEPDEGAENAEEATSVAPEAPTVEVEEESSNTAEEPEITPEPETPTTPIEESVSLSDDSKTDNSSDDDQQDNPAGPTIADLAAQSPAMQNEHRDYKITPSKLKKSPVRTRRNASGAITTTVVFIGLVSIIIAGLWTFLPGFDDSLMNLFG